MSVEAFSRGAKGFLIAALQRALKIDDDGIFGGDTEIAVNESLASRARPENGQADELFFNTLGLKWPCRFERCLQVTAAFEGTGFGGVNRTDIDDAGVTLGIVGFTTEHGEVQRLVTEYVRMRPSALSSISDSAKQKLLDLTRGSVKREYWDRWFYGYDGEVDKWIRDLLKRWGRDDLFQRLQLMIVETEMWLPALRSAKAMGISDSMHGLGLMFDIQVQNGGWDSRHWAYYNEQTHGGASGAKLRAIANAVAAKSKSKWRSDVQSRKMTFADGVGTVHDRKYDLACYGFGSK